MKGAEILNDPLRNKGTAFTLAEREALSLRGLLPPACETQEDQLQRVFENCARKPSDLERYIFLVALLDQNERLFYRALIENFEEYLPIAYTPTVGEASQAYAHIFRRPRGLYVSAEDRGNVREVLENWPRRDVRVIVCTDGERILGLGDLGANGMGIPIGKLALYTAAGGVDPATTLPIMLDVGTNNPDLIADRLYLGLRQSRLTGDSYLELMDEFVEGVQAVFPDALLQFEDFATVNAYPLLARYRDRARVFNDDIQGTAAVALAGVLGALKVTGGTLNDQLFLFLGAGSAATGIADLIVSALAREGIDIEDARRRCWFVNRSGLIVAGSDDIKPHSRAYAHQHQPVPDLLAAIEALKPTALIGATGAPGAFTREALEAMARLNERPIVFALSNPTTRSEVTAEDAYAWTDGRAVFASGSPFGPVTLDGRTFHPGQSNNVYIFPGVGLGVMASQAERVTDEMFLNAADALAAQLGDDAAETGCVFPPLPRIRKASAAIGAAVAETAWAAGLARASRPDSVPDHVVAVMWDPSY